MSGRGNWKAFELMRLRELFPRVPMARLARLLCRSPESIRRQARSLFARSVPVTGPFSAAETRVVRRAFGVLELADVALVLGRDVEDVAAAVEQLRSERRQGPWSRQEVALLKHVYGSRGDRDVAVCLSRSLDDVMRKAEELCLAKDKGVKPGSRMPRWSAGEVAQLRQLYPTQTNLAIARTLGRSVQSVANKAHQLGLSKSPATLRKMGRRNVELRHRG